MTTLTRADVFYRLIWAARLGTLLLVIAVAIALDTATSSSHRNDIRQQWQEEVDDISLELQSTILQNVQTVWGLAANVAIQPDIDGQRFRELASVILLVQGGEGLAGRIPIFEQASGEFWGVVSVILELEKLYSSIGLDRLEGDFNVALSSSSDIHDTESVFFSTQPFQWENPVTSTIRMRGISWMVFAEPPGGWPNHPRHPWIFRGCLFVLLGIVTAGVFWLTSLMSRDREMQQRLWGLFELAPMGIGLFSVHSNQLLRANPTFESQFGKSACCPRRAAGKPTRGSGNSSGARQSQRS